MCVYNFLSALMHISRYYIAHIVILLLGLLVPYKLKWLPLQDYCCWYSIQVCDLYILWASSWSN